MASSIYHRLILFVTIFIGILSITTTARPCRAFLISTYSLSIINPQNPNPNPNNFIIFKPHSLTFITQSNHLFLDRRLRIFANQLKEEEEFQHNQEAAIHHQHQQKQQFGLLSSQDYASLIDRTKDILSVVVALLFGVGCGALAASTIYLVWTLLTHRYNYLYNVDDDEDDDDEFYSESEEFDESPKKMGYATIPAGDCK
ncbi:hypothetical protein ACFE04_009514 [Oxalis oulophora]